MAKYYTRYNQARRRLSESIIRYGREPIFVRRIMYDVNRNQEPPPEEPVVGHNYFGRIYINPDAEEDANLLSGPEYRHLEELYGRLDVFELEVLVTDHNAAIRRDLRRGPDRRPPPPEGEVDPSLLFVDAVTVGSRPEELGFISLTDPRLNLQPVPLGMINDPTRAAYSWRAPIRQNSSQGLTAGCLERQYLTCLDGDDGGLRPLRDSFTRSDGLADTIRGVYPSFRETMNEIAGNPQVKSRAFDRDLAIEADTGLGLAFLWFKRAKIGWSETGDRWQLGSQYRFLAETLESKGVNIHACAA